MYVSARSYLTAGIATLGVGALALTPVAPISHSPVPLPAISTALAVDLAASIDPITPWIDTFQAAADNIGGLFNTWAAQPFPIIQQVIANQLTYLGELPAIGTIIEQVLGNIGAAIQAPFAADPSTLDAFHQLAFATLPQIADIPQALLDFTASPTSGLLIGLIGPFVAPVIALVDSVGSIVDALGNSDFLGALNDLINIPANLANAFLNGGQSIDLTGLLAPLVPAGTAVLNDANLVLGGLLSQGGSLFNALGVDVTVCITPKCTPPLTGLNVAGPGNPAGIFGSLIALTTAVADAITVVPAPTAAVAKAAAATAEVEVAPAEVEAAPAEVEADPVALSAEPDATDATDAVTLAATVEQPAATGDAPTRRGHDGGTRAARSTPSAAATASSGEDTGKASSGKARASRG